MGARNDIDLICSAAEFMLPSLLKAEKEVFQALETSGRTVYVNALRAFRIHRAVLAVGMFSMYEASLQSEFGWAHPFEELRKKLLAKDEKDLAAKFRNYCLTINVLKHGEGRSLEELLTRKDILGFRVKSRGDLFAEDGDVSEVDHLIDADTAFVQGCAEVIEDTLRSVREQAG